jgi:hypothetical protein
MNKRKPEKEVTIRNFCSNVGEHGIRVTISEPEEGINRERLSMALNLLLSEDDLRGYMISKSGAISRELESKRNQPDA